MQWNSSGTWMWPGKKKATHGESGRPGRRRVAVRQQFELVVRGRAHGQSRQSDGPESIDARKDLRQGSRAGACGGHQREAI